MKDISPIVNDFLGYLETVRNLSPATVKVYYYEVRIFLRFLKLRWAGEGYDEGSFSEISIDDIGAEELNRVNIQDLYAYLGFANRNLSNKSRAIARKVSFLRTFFKYLYSKVKVIDQNPTDGLETPKIEKPLPHYLTLEEAKTLIDTVNNNENLFFKYRDRAIIILFLNTGIRVSEMSSLNIDSVDFENASLRVLGKGNKERSVFLNRSALKAIEEYLPFRPNVAEEKEALFLSQKNNRITARGIQYMVEKYVKQSGLNSEEITVHKLRHTAATLMYQYGGGDIRAIQEILGHENVATTQIYTHVNDEAIRRAVEDNPLADI